MRRTDLMVLFRTDLMVLCGTDLMVLCGTDLAVLRDTDLTVLRAACGRSESPLPQPYVLGSRESVDGQWPWMVAVMTGPVFRCGGSLVDDQWVLTAGHCIYK